MGPSKFQTLNRQKMEKTGYAYILEEIFRTIVLCGILNVSFKVQTSKIELCHIISSVHRPSWGNDDSDLVYDTAFIVCCVDYDMENIW